MAISTLTSSLKLTLNASGAKSVPGRDPVTASVSHVKTVSLGTAQQPTSAGGADECVFQVRRLAPATTEDLDLSAALTNIVRDPTVTLVRIKGIAFGLLGSSEFIGASGSEITGSACTAILVGGDASNPWQGFFANTSDKLIVPNSGFAAVGGSTPAGFPVSSGMNDVLQVENPDASNTAAYWYWIQGGAS